MHALVLVHSPKMSCRSKDHSVETCHGCKPMRIENNKQHEKSLYFMLLCFMSPSFSSFVRFFFVSVAKFSLKKYDFKILYFKITWVTLFPNESHLPDKCLKNSQVLLITELEMFFPFTFCFCTLSEKVY